LTRKRPTTTDRVIDVAATTNQRHGAFGPPESNPRDRRSKRRHAYRAYVVIILVSPTGDRGKPILLRAKDISHTGMRVSSKQMIYPGSEGAVQMIRSNGRIALIGIEVKYCKYVGDMEHHTGLEFIPLPRGLTTDDFLDRDGRMVLLDPLLERNRTR
jgi:hypothetical protein